MKDQSAEKQLIKERVRLEDLVREVVADLRPRGAELWACCPFHTEDTPSFHLRPSLGVYKCFGCGESGDVFSFVQKTRGVGFREALELLAERAGVELGSLTPEERRRAAEMRRQREVLGQALELFRKALPAGGHGALAYLEGRGFSHDTLKRFDIGYISPDFQAALRRTGMDGRALEGAGFTRAFGGRVGFGIRDSHGSLVGFGARRLGDEDGPKYVNTRETPAFNKSRLLYGLDKAATVLARTRRLVVMEGYTDVMMAHQAGLQEAVATMGTSFTAEHLRLVKTRVGNLVFVFDGDEAGERAAERAVSMVLEAGLECRVVLLPEGQDPGDWFARNDQQAFEELLADEALSTVSFLARRLLGRLDPGQPGGREAVARELLEQTRVVTDPMRRDAIVADIARDCGVDRNMLRRQGGTARVSHEPSAHDDGGAQRGPVRAAVRSQFVAVGGLSSEPEAMEALSQLVDDRALDHPGALRLLELGRPLLAPGQCIDAMEWLDAVRNAEPSLVPALERVLMPPQDVILPSWAEAIAYLRRQVAERREQTTRREALSRPDLARDDEALRALAASLRDARRTNTKPSAGRTHDRSSGTPPTPDAPTSESGWGVTGPSAQARQTMPL